MLPNKKVKLDECKEVDNNNTVIITMDVGQGDCTYIDLSGFRVLVDAGRKEQGERAMYRLTRIGVTGFDMIVSSHGDEDHWGGFSSEKFIDLAKQMGQDDFVTFCNKSVNKFSYRGGTEVIRSVSFSDKKPEKGEVLVLAQGSRLQVNKVNKIVKVNEQNYEEGKWLNSIVFLHDSTPRDESANEQCPIIVINDNRHYHVICGDLTCYEKTANEIISWIANKGPAAEATLSVMVPHHGAQTSLEEKFLQKLKGKVPNTTFVISTGGRRYGHPRGKVLEWLNYYDINKIYLTNMPDIRDDGVRKDNGNKHNKLERIRIAGDENTYGDIIMRPCGKELKVILPSKLGAGTNKYIPTVSSAYTEDFRFSKSRKSFVDKKGDKVFFEGWDEKVIQLMNLNQSRGDYLPRHQNTISDTRTSSLGKAVLGDWYFFYDKNLNEKRLEMLTPPLTEFFDAKSKIKNKLASKKNTGKISYLEIMKDEEMKAYIKKLDSGVGGVKELSIADGVDSIVGNLNVGETDSFDSVNARICEDIESKSGIYQTLSSVIDRAVDIYGDDIWGLDELFFRWCESMANQHFFDAELDDVKNYVHKELKENFRELWILKLNEGSDGDNYELEEEWYRNYESSKDILNI